MRVTKWQGLVMVWVSLVAQRLSKKNRGLVGGHCANHRGYMENSKGSYMLDSTTIPSTRAL